MNHFVADVGNSRLKWARVIGPGSSRKGLLSRWNRRHGLNNGRLGLSGRSPFILGIASVNPPTRDAVCRVSRSQENHWTRPGFRRPLTCPSPRTSREPKPAARIVALGVLAATRIMPRAPAGLVVSCGTAITVERVTSQGVWEGGVIAPGLGVMARSFAHSYRTGSLARHTSIPCKRPTTPVGPGHGYVVDGRHLLGHRRARPRTRRSSGL